MRPIEELALRRHWHFPEPRAGARAFDSTLYFCEIKRGLPCPTVTPVLETIAKLDYSA